MSKTLAVIYISIFCLLTYAAPVKSMLGSLNQRLSEDSEPMPYDSLVEYIETTSTTNSKQYIDAKVILVESTGYVHDFKIAWRSTNPGGWGWYVYGLGNCTWIGIHPYNKRAYFGSNNLNYDWSAAAGWANYFFDSQSGYYVNDSLVYSQVLSIGTDTRVTARGRSLPILICWDLRYGWTYARHTNFRISVMTIDVDGEIVRDFHPCRITNEQSMREGALYDTISGEIFRNAGTGFFNIGPDIR